MPLEAHRLGGESCPLHHPVDLSSSQCPAPFSESPLGLVICTQTLLRPNTWGSSLF